ncbi:histidine kinase [Idiomarina sp. OT37-5b]|jgi:HD-like signal output (HDOD) protein|uniref:Histidine kinase n=1 Tax=Idiomarina aquatica TaxID=1327752 RepID=A0AA94ECV3_9GAMM|nr:MULTISPECIES: HDOD domain-containing protein [Idiomarina]AVJ56481.1 histidine kinase [Idiomarina sp. OT37-5b]RUO40010.1 histidine kinase [Idiomarina aquatica]
MAIVITAAEKKLLQNVSIPPRPQTLLTVSAEAKKEDPDVSVIADAIAADVGIAAAVLQVVNSAAYRRRQTIDSIQQAVMILGFRRVFPIVRAVALKRALSGNYDLSEFWRYNEWVASACAVVADSVGLSSVKDHAYMLGLFQNSGIAVMLEQFDDYADFVRRADSTSWYELQEQEQRQFDTSHTTIGALLAQQWKLPSLLVEAIYYLYDDSSVLSSDSELHPVAINLVSIAKLAKYAVDLRTRSLAGKAEWQQVEDVVMTRLKLDEVEVETLVAEVQDALFELNEA